MGKFTSIKFGITNKIVYLYTNISIKHIMENKTEEDLMIYGSIIEEVFERLTILLSRSLFGVITKEEKKELKEVRRRVKRILADYDSKWTLND